MVFNKNKASIDSLVKHETSTRRPYIYLCRMPTTLNISADVLVFQTSEHSRLKYSQLLLQYNLCQEHKSVGTLKRLFRILREY